MTTDFWVRNMLKFSKLKRNCEYFLPVHMSKKKKKITTNSPINQSKNSSKKILAENYFNQPTHFWD